ncbi:copper chaperone [Lachnotalea glycerini]|jgi:copper chaperone|uniref:Copper chaperone CopZ n=1 Tax=Lachnotalea glycerini TaxID=1763509 RepID=A0A318ESU4_9FIRM|nr:copper chaperone CopZ [Lachnotalea glycerini]PXV91062.1 copper chaperone [Lachnotalea glycerini]
MIQSVIKVDGMACDHCVKAITNALKALPGIGSVVVDLKAGTVAVEYDSSQSKLDQIKSEIEEQGYDIIE